MQITWLRLGNSTDKTDRQALVAYSNFNSNNRQVEFNANNPENDNENARGRASERVCLLCILYRFQPSSKHTANFLKFGLELEKSCFIHKFKL